MDSTENAAAKPGCLDALVRQLREPPRFDYDGYKAAKLMQEAADAIERLKPFEHELSYLVDRLGHDGGAVCGWGSKVPTAREWADAVYEAACDNEKFAREQALSNKQLSNSGTGETKA